MTKRKPVPGGRPLDPDKKRTLDDVMGDVKPPYDSKPPPYEEDRAGSIEEGEIIPELDEQLERLELETDADAPDNSTALGAIDENTETTSDVKKPSRIKTALGSAFIEAKHFAGGLISHPFEATKHYAILRHSLGLVYYQGPTTSVAITVLSDQPLPPDRRLWLQKKGYSGKTGLAIGTLGTRSAWIDVTPTLAATPDLLPKAEERAWQRDINRFLKKARDTKNLRTQRPYETNVVRIPHVAEDGYFRIVLCAGRKVLCPSPVFRFASTSTDPGMLRGASLRTLPLELGIKIGAYVANTAANAAASNALQPATTAFQNAIQPYQLGGLTQAAATSAYDSSGAPQKVGQVNEVYNQNRELSHQAALGDPSNTARLLGDDGGPTSPFPIKIAGKVIRGTGRSRIELGMPTANLGGVSEDTVLRLNGVYIAWARVSLPKKLKEDTLPSDNFDIWHPAVVTVAPARDAQAKVVERRFISAYLIYDFRGATFFDSKLSLMIMGFLRSLDQPTAENEVLQVARDAAVVQAWLDRPAWQAEPLLQRIKTESSARSFTERVADVRETGQRQVDKVPVHRLGVRTDSMGLRDQLIGNGGICVKR